MSFYILIVTLSVELYCIRAMLCAYRDSRNGSTSANLGARKRTVQSHLRGDHHRLMISLDVVDR